MNTNINWKDISVRAGKTFVQTFIAVITVYVTTVGDAHTAWAAILAAVAGAVSAAWNIIRDVFFAGVVD